MQSIGKVKDPNILFLEYIEQLNKEQLSDWTIEDTFNWAKNIIDIESAQKLKDEEVDGKSLQLFSFEDFTDFGMPLTQAIILTLEINKIMRGKYVKY